MSRTAIMIFAIFAYAVFFATFLYLIVFVGDLSFAKVTVNVGPQADPKVAALIDVFLIALFGIQHSVMARQGFKRWWTQFVPHAAERSVYVLMASLSLIVLFLFWRPIDAVVWNIGTPAIVAIIWAAFWLGWGMVLVSTFLLNHFELFGLQQAWFHATGRKAADPELRQPLFYRWIAHPLYSGFTLAFWATPQMTVGHLLLAIGMTIYMLIAIRYEERDLVAFYGKKYEDYRSGVGMLTPRFRRRSS
jgi:protein-S-isoprenylcysteine O-methyltransferase Ste14